MNKSLYLGSILTSVLLTVTACKGLKLKSITNSDDTKENTLFVNNHKVECSAFSLDLCIQIRSSKSDDWKNYDGNIQSFNYQWGYDYELEVDVKTLDPIPQDAPEKEYTLNKVISKDKTSDTTTFNLTVSRAKTADLIKKVNDSTYKIYNEKNLQCTTDDCATIESLITQDSAILFKVRHDADPNKALRLSEIKCSSARASFKSSCLGN